MGFFDGLSQAPVYEKGQFFEPGDYKLDIQKVIPAKSTRKGDMFIVEFVVLESNNPNVPPGSRRTWMQKLLDKQIAFPAIVEFVIAASGVSTDDKETVAKVRGVIEDVMNQCNASNDDNPLTGRQVYLNAFQRKTLKGTDFTVHNWKPVTE